MSDEEELAVKEEENFKQEEVEDVEGKIGNFFRGLFRDKKKSENYKVEEDEDDEDEDDFVEDGEGCNPFIRDSKLFGQDFDKLKRRCQETGELFRDKRFGPVASSLFYSSPSPDFQWMRPHQLCDEPHMFVDGADRFDINQGELGDCWLLAALASLAMDHMLLHKVMDPRQSFQSENGYCGIFRFRFWQYGEWVDVVVDDYLPCLNGRLAYIHSDSKSEFWCALLEKAYAKLHGSYEALKGGSTCEAMVDFTGGCSEVWELKGKEPKDLFTVMLKGYKRRSLSGCSIKPDPNVHEAKTANGLVQGHAYTLSKVVKAAINTSRVEGLIPLVRVRNPWGDKQEWRGTWADGGKEWSFIPDEEKKRMGLTFDHDGEWWMSYRDFVSNFDQLEMCNLSPDDPALSGEGEETCSLGPGWCVASWHGSWVGGETSGGCRNFLETFIHNPQFLVTLEDVDEEDDEPLCTLIVSLMQKGRRALRHEGVSMLSIGFVIYHIRDPDLAAEATAGRRLGEDFFKYNLSTARSKSFINMREVTARFKLLPGTYLIVPSTYEPGFEGEFLIRTFTENPNSSQQLQS